MYLVYVLQNSNGELYKGSTSDVEERIIYHNRGWSHWTKGRGPWHLVHSECFQTKTEALKRERFLKSGKGREYLHNIISSRDRAVGSSPGP